MRFGILSEREAAERLRRCTRQIRRLRRRLEAAGGDPAALSYQRTHGAPNRLGDGVRTEFQALVKAHPRWSTPALWEAG